MAETLIVATCATIAWAIVGFAIPWMTRLAVLYRLHDLRDDIYDAAERFPAARRTRTYRNLEFLVTMALHVVRERSYEESVAFAAVLISREHAISPEIQEAARTLAAASELEAQEIFVGDAGKAARAKLMTVPSAMGWLMAVRVVFGNPFVMVASLALIVFSVCRRLLSHRRKGGGNSDEMPQMARSLQQLAEPATPPGTLATIRILPTLIPRNREASRALGLKHDFVQHA